MPRRNSNAVRERTRPRYNRGATAVLRYKFTSVAVTILGKPDPLGYVLVDTGTGTDYVHRSRLTTAR